MSLPPATLKPRFSRKALNFIMVGVAILIFVLSRMNTPSSDTATTSSTTPSPNPIATEDTSPTSDAIPARALTHLLDIKTHAKNTPQTPIDLPIQTWQHPSGAQLLFAESPEIPMLDLEVIFDAGSARDAGLPGLARMTSNLIGEGTPQHSVEEIAQAFEALGSEFSTASGRDMGVATLRTLTSEPHLRASLALFTEVLSQPTFPSASLERIRNVSKISLSQEKASPRQLISKATWQALYGDHPYGSHPLGTEASLDEITVEKLQHFHQTHYTAANATITLVGAISWEKAKKITEQLIAALPAGKPLEPLPPAKPIAETQHIHIDFPSQQTHIRIATRSIHRLNDQLIPLFVANEVLGGGGFTSQLNKVIRQDNGLAYSVYSYAGAMKSDGFFVIDLQTQNDNAIKALAMAQETLNTFLQNGPDTHAFKQAQEHMVASFPLGVSTNSAILGQLAHMGYYHLPSDYLKRYIKQVLATTPQSAHDAFTHIIGQKKRLVITLGPTKPELNE